MLQSCIHKGVDTSDMLDLTVPLMIVCFFVMKKWFLCTDAVNDDTVIVLCYYCISPNHLSVMPECVRNIHHISQLPDHLAAVDLAMLLVALILALVMVPSI